MRMLRIFVLCPAVFLCLAGEALAQDAGLWLLQAASIAAAEQQQQARQPKPQPPLGNNLPEAKTFPAFSGYHRPPEQYEITLGLTGLNPQNWGKLVELNPFLKEPGRVFLRSDGVVVVTIRSGELVGFSPLGIQVDHFYGGQKREEPTSTEVFVVIFFACVILICFAVFL